MSMDFGCSCCAVPTLVYSCIGVLIVSHLIGKLPLNGKAQIGLKLVSYGAAVIIAVCAILMQMLEKDPELRSWFFAKLCSALSKSAALNEKRCRLLSDAKGVVVEIGLGPGTNFKVSEMPNNL